MIDQHLEISSSHQIDVDDKAPVASEDADSTNKLEELTEGNKNSGNDSTSTPVASKEELLKSTMNTTITEQMQPCEEGNENLQPSNELTHDKVKWLEGAFKKKNKEVDEHQSQMRSHELTQDRIKWLQEDAFKKKMKSTDGDTNVQASHELTKDRVKWLQEEAFKKKMKNADGDGNVQASHELTQDRVKWLNEEAFKKKMKDADDSIVEPSNELTQDKVKWLQEEAFKKKMKNADGIIVEPSNELTQDKVKWLQEEAFKKKMKDAEGSIVEPSHELTQDKVKWLQEKAFKHQIKNTEDSTVEPSHELTQDKVKWLQEDAFKKVHENNLTTNTNLMERVTVEKKESDDTQPDIISNSVSDGEPLMSDNNMEYDADEFRKDDKLEGDDDDDEIFYYDNNDDESNQRSDTMSPIPEEDEESEGETAKEKDETDIPTDDLYKLLAFSKNRLEAIENETLERKMVEQEIQQDDEDVEDNEEEDEDTHQDDESKEELKQQSEENDTNTQLKDDVNEQATDLQEPQAKQHVESDIVSETTEMSDSTQSKKQKYKNDNAELWALLNYSKLRLATGATPKLNSDNNDDLSEQNSDSDEEEEDDDDADGDDVDGFAIVHDQIDLDEELEELSTSSKGIVDVTKTEVSDSSVVSFDDEELNQSGSDDWMKEMLSGGKSSKTWDADARIRAMEALARASQHLGDRGKEEEVDVDDDHLILKSLHLAEAAAKEGATEFRTKDKLKELSQGGHNNLLLETKSSDSSSQSNGRGIRSRYLKFVSRTQAALKDFRETVDRVNTMPRPERRRFS